MEVNGEMATHPMRLGLLFESDEWSDWHLRDELSAAGFAVEMIDLADEGADTRALSCQALACRVFASAYERGHEGAVACFEELLPHIEKADIPMVNPPRAFAFETSKRAASRAAAQAGLDVPAIHLCCPARELAFRSKEKPIPYPTIVKPDCGGRGADTFIVHDGEELTQAALSLPPEQKMLVQDYVRPERGFLDRIEIVDGKAALVFKRSIGDDGLSGYHHGSSYERYTQAPPELLDACQRAAQALDFIVGSFDVIENGGNYYFIDFNSVSNVSEDCTELYGMDLMRAHAKCIARRLGISK